MDGVLLALIGVIGTLVGGFLWFLKFLARKMFGKNGDGGFVGKFLESFNEMKESQSRTEATLLEILRHTETARRSEEDPDQARV